jgi:3-(3-hydroxy-phenyl)propionate hydroxylase
MQNQVKTDSSPVAVPAAGVAGDSSAFRGSSPRPIRTGPAERKAASLTFGTLKSLDVSLTSVFDLIVVGLGPTGAMLANLMGLRGHSVLCVERDQDIYYSPKAVHFDDEIMRIFQSAGLAEEIARTSESFAEMAFLTKPHSRPAWKARVGTQDNRYGHAGAWFFHQPTLERQFRAGLERFPKVRCLLGVMAKEMRQDEQGVSLVLTQLDGSEREVRGRFLIGCDGGRSTIRRLAELSLCTADFDEPWVVVDTKTRSGRKHPELPPIHQQICNPAQPITYVPIAAPYYEWQFMVTGKKSEREATDPVFVRSQLREFVDLDTIEIIRIAYYKFHALWARKWRNGRVMLAGDSAHQMPPFLGQGMCSGIRDADSLSWRLSLILKGLAATDLLDDYETERSVHVQHIIQGAMFLGRVIQTRRRSVAWLRNFFLFRLANTFPAYGRFIMTVMNRKRPLESGWLGKNRPKLAGKLSLQPTVATAAGDRVPLDSLQGEGFAIIARAASARFIEDRLPSLGNCLPVRLIPFAEQPAGKTVGDFEGRLIRQFDEHAIDFLIVRPDHYIFDGGRITDFEKVASQFSCRFRAVEQEVHA